MNDIFDRCVADYHVADNVDAPVVNPYPAGSFEAKLYDKCWVDAVQWHLEDLIRDPEIDPVAALALKLWHMQEQAERPDASEELRQRSAARLEVLREQRKDLTAAIETLLEDIAAGRKYMKVYRQMKLYNDPETNPVLYSKK